MVNQKFLLKYIAAQLRAKKGLSANVRAYAAVQGSRCYTECHHETVASDCAVRSAVRLASITKNTW